MITRDLSLTDLNLDPQDLMEFDAIGVPWGQCIEHAFGREVFDPGSVELHPNGTLVFWCHREPIGRVTAATSTDRGYQITGSLSRTSVASDVWELMRDGVIDRMSIGFEPVESWYDETTATTHWTKVVAREFSLVPFPAYDDTPVTNLRHHLKETHMDVTRDDITALASDLDDLKRSVAILDRDGTGPLAASTRWRTLGSYLKDLAGGDAEAADLHRAYTGGTTADTVLNESFLGGFIRMVQDRRRLTSIFGTKALPEKGLSVDYYQLLSDTTTVAKQASEGADLTKGKVTLKKANTPIDTYGGWTELSVQEIERAPLPILDTTLAALGITYGRVTEATVRATFAAQVTASIAAGGARSVTLGATLAASTINHWLDAVIDAADIYETNGFALNGLIISKDVYRTLIKLVDGSGRRLVNVYPDNDRGAGHATLSALAGDLAGVPVTCAPRLDDGTAAFIDPVAMDVYESPGAPAQLQDANVVNLSKAFSVYGYLATVVPFPQAIVGIKLAAN